MSETDFDWDDLRLFLAVARAGGLAGAASATGKSAPTLGRRMLTLERKLGRELFERLPRGYALTEEGQALLDQAGALEDRLRPIIARRPEDALPVVKVSAGLWTTHLLCRKVHRVLGEDALRLRFIAADEMVDIGRRAAVIGIRNQRPESPTLAGRRVTRIRFAAYAVNDSVTPWAQVIGPTPSAKWVQQTARSAPRIEVTNARSALDLAEAGAARVVLPMFIGARLSHLQQVGPEIEALAHDQWLVTHHEDRFVPVVRRVIDRIHDLLKAECSMPPGQAQ
ncbi:LysR family transcriptional regulator [uncultured Roseobacter sp.]|uniref:LysR family transcriptional regulator n=1 Tax=uncultured Roseobacter sp. TaxID=114847 RepID=UPI002638533D|nr:LysR family transcriptional regulator [uncultured Roseobacter sp.]